MLISMMVREITTITKTIGGLSYNQMGASTTGGVRSRHLVGRFDDTSHYQLHPGIQGLRADEVETCVIIMVSAHPYDVGPSSWS